MALDDILGGLGDAFDLSEKDYTSTTSTATIPQSVDQTRMLSSINDFVGTQNLAGTEALGSLRSGFGTDQANNNFTQSQTSLGRALNPTGLSLTADELSTIRDTFGTGRRDVQKVADAAVGRFGGGNAGGSALASNIADMVNKRSAEESQIILNENNKKKEFTRLVNDTLAKQQLQAADTRLKLSGQKPPGTDAFNTLSDVQRTNISGTETKPGPTSTAQFGTLASGIGAILTSLKGGGGLEGIKGSGILDMLGGLIGLPGSVLDMILGSGADPASALSSILSLSSGGKPGSPGVLSTAAGGGSPNNLLTMLLGKSLGGAATSGGQSLYNSIFGGDTTFNPDPDANLLGGGEYPDEWMGGYDQTDPGYVPPADAASSIATADDTVHGYVSGNDPFLGNYFADNPDTFFDAVAGGEGAGNFTLNNTAGLWGQYDPWELDPWEA